MQNLQNFVVYAVAFIILIGLMVVVHEFGHFIVAKLFRVRVESFSVGFGPRLFGIKYGDTDYKVCLLPLGGFVKMTGENFAEVGDAASGTANQAPLDDPGAFTSHPRWQRMLIGLAGPVANFILAFVLMVMYFSWINEVPDIRPVTLEWVAPGSAAGQDGLQPGDIIRNFGNTANPDLMTFVKLVSASSSQAAPVTVERGGETHELILHLPGAIKGKGYDLSSAGIYPRWAQGPIVIDQVSANSPAEQAGLRSGDSILAVDGYAFHTLEPFVDYLQRGQGKPVTLSVNRNGVSLPPIVVHPYTQDSQWRIGFSYEPPLDPPMRVQPMPIPEATSTSLDFCRENSLLIVDTLKKLITRKVSVKQLSGPLGIAVAAGQAAETKSWYRKFGLAAAISLNLGILNLLPFPILDGGLILLLLIESALRHDISINVKERIYQAAFVVLMAFFAFIMFNDATKLHFFTHLKP